MKILLLDIETAPHKVYVWSLFDQSVGINQIDEPGYTLCWAAKWLHDKKSNIMFSSVHEDGERKMISKIWKLIDEADAVIHYNGSKFDMPILNQEFLKHGLRPPSPVTEIDLYRTVRRKMRLPSSKLDYVARHLNLEGKLVHKGMSLWRGCMDGDEKSWKVMKRYNIQDIHVLENVYNVLLPWIPNHPNHALFDETSSPVCPNCGSDHLEKRGLTYTKTQAYQRYVCKGCGKWSRGGKTVVPPEKRDNVLTSL